MQPSTIIEVQSVSLPSQLYVRIGLLRAQSYSLSDWPITVSSDTHTPFHHWLLYWGEEMMYWWIEQHEQNRLYTHKLSQHARADRQSCIQRWALVLSTIDRDVINVLTCTHFISFIWASYWPSSTATSAVCENGFINDDVTQYNKKRLLSKFRQSHLNMSQSVAWFSTVCVRFW